MNKRPIIIVDADAIIAQTNPEDLLHKKATTISKKLIDMDAEVYYPVTAIAEAATHMQRVLNSNASAFGTAQIMTGQDAQVLEVNKDTLTNAVEYFSPTASKKNTLFDCIVAALAKEHKADAIFSFDSFYKKRGFNLAEDLK